MAQPTRCKRQRRRVAQRGAAMVEAAFMLPMFIILYYGSLYAHNLGYNYIKTNQASRANAWAYAMTNCGERGNASDDSEVLPPVTTAGGDGAATKLSPMPDNTGKQVVVAAGVDASINHILGFIGRFGAVVARLFPEPDAAQSVNKVSLNWRLPNLYDGSQTGASSRNTTAITQSVTVDCNNAINDGGVVKTLDLLGESAGSFLSPSL